jgi:hypothetical protein
MEVMSDCYKGQLKLALVFPSCQVCTNGVLLMALVFRVALVAKLPLIGRELRYVVVIHAF